jgi:hypothetical protein
VYKNYGFTYFEIANEPNINGITAQDYVKIAQYASDAVESAVHKVNASVDPEIMTPALSAVPEHTNPTDEQYLADTLNLHGTGIDTNTGDSYSKYISYHAYRDPTTPDPNDPSTPYQVAELERIKSVIQSNNPDNWVDDMFVTEMNSGLSRDSDDPLQNARLAHLFMQMINHGKSYNSTTSWMKGILKFKFDETNGGSVFQGSPEYTGPHLNYFTFNEVAQAAQRIKDIMQLNTTIPEDQVLVSRDPSYYYILFSNISSVDTSKITLDTSTIGITSAPAHFVTTNANQAGTRWDKQITNGSLVYYVAPETVTLVKIPRNYTAKTISSISISPSAAINVNLYGAKEFTATAHYTDGSTNNITDLVNWSSSNNNNVNMLSTGLAYGIASGTSASITCSYDGVTSNSVTFNVN